VKLLKEMGIRCMVYQPPYSILNRWPEEEGILDYLLEEKIGCVVFSPLAQGMLTPKYLEGIPADSRAARPEGFLTEEQVIAHQEKIRALGDLAAAQGMSLPHMAINWTLRHKAVTSAIIGARTVAQLDDCLNAVEATPLDDSVIEAVNDIAPGAKSKNAEG
jgi:L-glyceraldehyde 3-phosphate reductase